MKLKNYDELVDEMTALIKQFACDCNPHYSYVHLKYDKNTKQGELVVTENFDNVCDVGWDNDGESYCLYIDTPHTEGVLDYWQTIDEFAEALEVSEDDLIAEAADYLNIAEVDYWDVQKYICENKQYADVLFKQYTEALDSRTSEIHSEAETIVNRFITDRDYSDEEC